VSGSQDAQQSFRDPIECYCWRAKTKVDAAVGLMLQICIREVSVSCLYFIGCSDGGYLYFSFLLPKKYMESFLKLVSQSFPSASFTVYCSF